MAFWLKGYNLSTGKTTLVLLFNTVLIRPNFRFSLYPRRCVLFRLPVGGQPIVTTLGMRLAAKWRQIADSA